MPGMCRQNDVSINVRGCDMPCMIYVCDESSARPRLVVRSGRVGRGRVLLSRVLPVRAGVYRLGYVDSLLLHLRESHEVYMHLSFVGWYIELTQPY